MEKAIRHGEATARPQGVAEAELARRHWALALCFVAAVFEGIDLQSMGVAAPGVSAEFHLLPAQLGYVGSASSVGLLFGAMFGGMMSDRIGRRLVLLWAVSLFGCFSILTPWASDVRVLVAVRFATGLGLGAGLPMIIAIAAEAAPPDRRGGTVTMMYSATPLGGVIVSALAFLAAGHWRLLFYAGGMAPLLLTPLLYWRLRDAAAVCDVETTPSRGVGRALFGEGRALPTLLLWVSFLGSLLVLYLLLNWLPLLLVGKGFSRGQASLVQIAFNLGGSLGALLLGWSIDRINRRVVLGVAFLGVAAGLAVLASLQGGMLEAVCSGFGLGIFANGTPFLLYGLVPAYYARSIRGTGVGASVAFGRLGSIIGPILAGTLLGAGQTPTQVLINITPIVLAAALAVQLLQLFHSDSLNS